MRTGWLFVLSVCLAKTAFAQTFNATPGPLLEQEIQFNQANECFIHFNNPSGDSLQLHWRLVESNLPPEWDADLCDYGWCYTGIPSNGLMSTVYDTIQPYLKLIVQPAEVPGATWIWFRVYEEGHPDNFVDVFYSLHTPGTLSTTTQLESALRAYPNPVADNLFLENNQSDVPTARITDANGKVIWKGIVPAFSRIEVSVADWPAGLYCLQCGNLVQKVLVQK